MRPHRLPRLAAALAGLIWAGASAAAPAAGPEGVWLVGDQSAKIRVAPCADHADRLCGYVVWMKQAEASGQPPRDLHNPDPALRSRPVLGMAILRDFHPAGEGRWDGGKIYDVRSGRTVGGRMRLTPQGGLRVEGCIAMICPGETWRRSS